MAGLYSSKSYNLKSLKVIPASASSDSTAVDITGIMIEMSLYEDIYSPSIYGEVLVGDTTNLITQLSLTGQGDVLAVEFNKPGEEGKSTVIRKCRITGFAIADRQNSRGGQVFVLKFCSEELLYSCSLLLSKSYKSMTISDMLKDILTKEMGVGGNRIQKIESSDGLFSFIIPSMEPLEAALWLTNRALKPSFFYETLIGGYAFRSFENMVSSTPKRNYFTSPQNINNGNQSDEAQLSKIIRYDFLRSNDVMHATTHGMFSGQLMTFDPLRLKFTRHKYNYEEWFAQNKHLRKGSFYNGYRTLDGKKLTEQPSIVRFIPTNLNHDNIDAIRSAQPGLLPFQQEKTLMPKISLLEQLEYFKMRIVVPGDSSLSVGDVVKVSLPNASADSESDIKNKLYSGSFLITAINHKINLDHYEMIMELATDSFSENASQAAGTSLFRSSTNKTITSMLTPQQSLGIAIPGFF